MEDGCATALVSMIAILSRFTHRIFFTSVAILAWLQSKQCHNQQQGRDIAAEYMDMKIKKWETWHTHKMIWHTYKMIWHTYMEKNAPTNPTKPHFFYLFVWLIILYYDSVWPWAFCTLITLTFYLFNNTYY